MNMRSTLSKMLGKFAVAGTLTLPFLALAQDESMSSAIDNLITLGYYVSSIGYLIATIIMIKAVMVYGKSAFGSIFSYISIGTGIFFIITIFQKLGGDFFKIGAESMDIWWHVMFYMAIIFYFAGIKLLVALGGSETENSSIIKIGAEKKWGAIAVVFLIIIFTIPSSVDSIVMIYENSALGAWGLHHFLSFALAGVVGYYLVNAKKTLGQIGHAIATPMIIAIWALCIQHFWELLTESWQIIELTSDKIEGVEKIFLTISAISMCYVGIKLKALAKKG